MTAPAALSHFGIHVTDIARMEDFYTRVLGLLVSDRGTLAHGPTLVLFVDTPWHTPQPPGIRAARRVAPRPGGAHGHHLSGRAQPRPPRWPTIVRWYSRKARLSGSRGRGSATRTSATTVPGWGDSTITRSARYTASATLWVT